MSNSLQVLHIHSGNLYGGVETVLNTLVRCRTLSPALEHHFALCFDGRLSKELEAMDAPIHRLGNARISRPLSVWRARHNLAGLLRRQKFDVAICHSSWSQSLFGKVARQPELPLIFWLHDEAKGKHWLERWARHTRPDLVVCNSRFTATTVDKLYPGVKSEVIYYPIAPPEVSLTPLERGALRQGLNTPADATVIIQVSRMEEWKGQKLHLQALSVLRDLPDWICWMVGGAQRPQEQGYLAELQLMARQLGIADRVRFLGQRSDVPRLLAAADIFCQPNFDSEPFGITFIEALYAQLPVVSTAFGGALEIVDDSCGMLTPPGDRQALANILQRLIENPGLRARLGAAGVLRAHQIGDARRQLGQIKDLCNTLTLRAAA